MNDKHEHRHHHDENTHLGLAFFLNLVFTIIELVGGLWTNSLAVLSDAIHDFGDCLAIGSAWYLEKISNKPVDTTYTYGYRRFSILGAIISSIILSIGSVIIVQNALPRLYDVQPVQSQGMMLMALLGIVFNGFAFFKTSHGHSHNERMISLHLLEDLLGWTAVLIGAIIIYYTGWYILDPILSIVIAIYILINVIKGVRSFLPIILQSVPEGVDFEQIEARIRDFEQVADVRDLHIWSMDGEFNILSCHIVLNDHVSIQEWERVKRKINDDLKELKIHHCTLEIAINGEPYTQESPSSEGSDD